MYSDLYTKSHNHTPRVLALIAVMVLVGTFMFSLSSSSSPTRASRKTLLMHEVVNRGPGQIGVFWEVDSPDEGWVIYGTSPQTLDQIAGDERGTDEARAKRKYHYALLRNIKPDTEYFYRIISDNEVIQQTDGEPFSARSLSGASYSSSLSPIYGKVVRGNGEPARESIAFVIIGNASPILSLTGKTGEWLVPLQYVVEKNGTNMIPITEDTVITIQLFDDTLRSMVRSTIERSRPIPQPVTLGNNYSFIVGTDVLAATDQAQNQPVQRQNTIDIRFPIQNAVIPGVAPIIKGYGIPGASVEVTISSKTPFTGRVVVDEKGEWSVPVQTGFSPGAYRLIMKTQDQRGKQVQMVRDFTLIKSGERVLGESSSATPSATLVPSRTTSQAPTRSPTNALTITPIRISPTPTVSPQISPSPFLSITQSPQLSPTLAPTAPPPPVSGINLIPIFMAGMGMIVVGMGVIFLL